MFVSAFSVRGRRLRLGAGRGKRRYGSLGLTDAEPRVHPRTAPRNSRGVAMRSRASQTRWAARGVSAARCRPPPVVATASRVVDRHRPPSPKSDPFDADSADTLLLVAACAFGGCAEIVSVVLLRGLGATFEAEVGLLD